MSVLITTYEGTHNHPLPISATAMASTTSAAASMLMSGSTTSGTSGQPQSAAASFTSGGLNGLNFYLSDNSKPKPFYLPNSSLSSSPSFPTITLDLTTNPSAASHLHKLGNNFPPRYSTTNLNFSSLESNSLPISWGNGIPDYGNQQPYNKIQNTNSLSFGRNPQETLYQSYLQKNILKPAPQNLPSETIAAATKAITSDPSFQSALAAALTTIIGSCSSTGALANQTSTDKSALNMKSIESFPVLSSFPSNSNVNKCASSFLSSKPASSADSQPGNLAFLSPSLPFSTTTNSKATFPGDNRDHIS